MPSSPPALGHVVGIPAVFSLLGGGDASYFDNLMKAVGSGASPLCVHAHTHIQAHQQL